MSRHSQARSGYGPLPQVVLLLLGSAVAVVVWVYLVVAAIDFGGAALGGEVLAWAFMVAPMVGAAACFVLVLTLVYRALYLLGLVTDYKPRRSSGRRRA